MRGRNISGCGLAVVAPLPMAPGDVVGVRSVREGCDEDLSAVARVARYEPVDGGFLVGLEFLAKHDWPDSKNA